MTIPSLRTLTSALRGSLTLEPVVTRLSRRYYASKTFNLLQNNPTIVGGPPKIVTEIALAANYADLKPIIVHPRTPVVKAMFKARDVHASAFHHLPKDANTAWYLTTTKIIGASSIIIFPGKSGGDFASSCITRSLLDHFWARVSITRSSKEEIAQKFVCAFDSETFRLDLFYEVLNPKERQNLVRVVKTDEPFEFVRPNKDCKKGETCLEGLSLTLLEKAFLPLKTEKD